MKNQPAGAGDESDAEVKSDRVNESGAEEKPDSGNKPGTEGKSALTGNLIPTVPPVPTFKFYPVSIPKFVILTVVTGGFYNIYWFYKNWKYLKQTSKEHVDIWPFWRAVFGRLWYFSFLKNLDPKMSTGMVVFLGVMYLVMAAFWELPGVYALAGFLEVVFLLPAAMRINKLNNAEPALKEKLSISKGYNWHWSNAILILAGLVLLFLVFVGVASEMNLIPSTQVVTGNQMWEKDINYLESSGIVLPGETVQYFYSSMGMFSIKEEGKIVTDKRVISYEVDENDEMQIYEAKFDEILELWVGDPDIWGNVWIEVVRKNGSSFYLIFSNEENSHRAAIDFIESRLNDYVSKEKPMYGKKQER